MARAKIFAAAIFSIAAASAQIQDRAENLDFSDGAVGQMPPGWNLGDMRYTAVTLTGASCHNIKQCGNVHSLGPGPHGRVFLYQVIDATPYRGKWLSYRASVRAEMTSPGSAARLLVRVHRADSSTSFRDDMGAHPITSSSWATYEIDAPIDPNARDIEFGMQVFGDGSATIDNISLDFDWVNREQDKAAVRDLIKKFADARNAHDGTAAAALYSENGEWSAAGQNPVRGRQALAELWSAVTGQVERTVDSVDFLSPSIAVVHVTTDYPEPIGRHQEVFVAVREAGGWFIRLHQTLN